MPDVVTPPGQTEPVTPPVRPAYAVPQVTTYTDAALLEALGPAQAGGSYTVFGGP